MTPPDGVFGVTADCPHTREKSSVRNPTGMFLMSAVLLMAVASPPAQSLEMQTLAAGACKSALPVFDGNIRSRPLAVQNEGTASAFVTCAQQAEIGITPRLISIVLVNTGADALTVNCTMVNGVFGADYYSESMEVPAGANNAILRFRLPEQAVFNDSMHAFSCSLPPETGISRIAYIYG